jgi:hypothetical protein
MYQEINQFKTELNPWPKQIPSKIKPFYSPEPSLNSPATKPRPWLNEESPFDDYVSETPFVLDPDYENAEPILGSLNMVSK